MTKTIILTSIAAVAASANAAVTYVDTTTSNSTIGGAAPVAGTNYTVGRTGGDDLWGQETAFFTGGIFAAQNEIPATLTTTVTVPSDTYTVYAFYVAQTATPATWDVSANITGETPINVVGESAPSVLASTLDFVTDPIFTEQNGGLSLYALELGTVTGTTISVDLNALDGNDRTWVDGIGYEAVPEPSSLALLALGGLGLLRRRR